MLNTGMANNRGESLYDCRDLAKSILYCKYLIEREYKKEPFYGFCLKGFVKWARRSVAAMKRHRQASLGIRR